MAKKVICIDAGHGGRDPGAVNGKRYEKDAALMIAKKVGKALAERGYEVRYTRTTDNYFSLSERARMANNWSVDAFISIHLNAASRAGASGVETWRYSNVGDKTKRLANAVQSELIAATGAIDRGVKTSSSLYVLKHTKASAVLVECGFITNQREGALLFSDDYQNKVAAAIAKGVASALK